jgi:hypothetical protein
VIWVVAFLVAGLLAIGVKRAPSGTLSKSIVFGVLGAAILTPVLGRISDLPFPTGFYLAVSITNSDGLLSQLQFVSRYTILAAFLVAVGSAVAGNLLFFRDQKPGSPQGMV